MRIAFLVVAACGGSDSPAIDAPPGGGEVPIDAAMFDPLVGIGNVETVQGGFMFTEGPQWREATSDLVFSDIPANTIFRYTGTGAPVSFKMPSNMSNGLAMDNAGKLVAAEHGSRSVTRWTMMVGPTVRLSTHRSRELGRYWQVDSLVGLSRDASRSGPLDDSA